MLTIKILLCIFIYFNSVFVTEVRFQCQLLPPSAKLTRLLDISDLKCTKQQDQTAGGKLHSVMIALCSTMDLCFLFKYSGKQELNFFALLTDGLVIENR